MADTTIRTMLLEVMGERPQDVTTLQYSVEARLGAYFSDYEHQAALLVAMAALVADGFARCTRPLGTRKFQLTPAGLAEQARMRAETQEAT